MSVFTAVSKAAKEYGAMRITCTDGTSFVGKLFVIDEASDDEGEDLGYELAYFDLVDSDEYVVLREEDILKIEKP